MNPLRRFGPPLLAAAGIVSAAFTLAAATFGWEDAPETKVTVTTVPITAPTTTAPTTTTVPLYVLPTVPPPTIVLADHPGVTLLEPQPRVSIPQTNGHRPVADASPPTEDG